MGHPVSLSTSTGRISAWRADPPIPPLGAVVVVQEIFGVNAHIRAVVERFAAHGWTAIAPAAGGFTGEVVVGVELQPATARTSASLDIIRR